MTKTKFAKMYDGAPADEERVLTADELAALPGLLGRIAQVMLPRHGVYGYTDATTGKRILLRLAR